MGADEVTAIVEDDDNEHIYAFCAFLSSGSEITQPLGTLGNYTCCCTLILSWVSCLFVIQDGCLKKCEINSCMWDINFPFLHESVWISRSISYLVMSVRPNLNCSLIWMCQPVQRQPMWKLQYLYNHCGCNIGMGIEWPGNETHQEVRVVKACHIMWLKFAYSTIRYSLVPRAPSFFSHQFVFGFVLWPLKTIEQLIMISWLQGWARM